MQRSLRVTAGMLSAVALTGVLFASVPASAQNAYAPFARDSFSYYRHNMLLHNVMQAKKKKAEYLRRQAAKRKAQQKAMAQRKRSSMKIARKSSDQARTDRKN